MRSARRSRRTAGRRAGCSAAFRCRIVCMSQSPDRVPGGLVLRLSVPAGGDLRPIATELATRVAQYLGDRGPDGAAVAAALDGVAARVAPASGDAEITFDFREVGGELVIEAHCGSRSSEVRCPLPA